MFNYKERVKMKKTVLIAAAILSAAALYGKILKLEIPAVNLQGTPVPIRVGNLEPKGTNPSPEVPDNVVNVAKGKSVSSSDDMPLLGELEMITDGDKEAGDGSYVELADGKQWVQIDLDKEYNIYAVAVWHFHQREIVYNDVVVQLSNDPKFVDGVKTIFNNDIDNSSKLGKGSDKGWIETNAGKLIALKDPIKARYVRFYSNGSNEREANHYIEVEVFGN